MHDLDLEYLRSVLDYEPDTGRFRWRAPRQRIRVGGLLSQFLRRGYALVDFEGQRCFAHRLVWFHVHGAWPVGEIDHSNRVRHDNRIANLREATKAQNMANSVTRAASGSRGVARTRSGRWKAQITVGRNTRHLGTFDDIVGARLAYACAAAEAFGDYATTEL